VSWFYASLVVLLLGGVVAGFLGDWWGHAWIWASLGILVVTSLAMLGMARPYYRRVGVVARAMAGGSTAVSPEQLDEILRGPRPVTLAWIGFLGLLAIMYLMMFKPSLGLGAGAAPPPAADVRLVAEGIAFDAGTVSAPAGRAFTILLDNRDPVPHDVAIYTDRTRAEQRFDGEDIIGPRTITYRVPALRPGTYFFLCTVHPQQMTGTLVAGA
jgi:plastocyanin